MPLEPACTTLGNGPEHVLAFHGFGGSWKDFAALGAVLGERFTIHAFDIWFHGASHFPNDRSVDDPIRPEEISEAMTAFLDRKGVDRAWYMGFSLGGRLALSLMERAPERSHGLLLFAPDGLVRNPWYRGLARWAWGRRLYHGFLRRPDPFMHLVQRLHRWHLLSDRMKRYLLVHTDTPEKRQLVHDVWLSLRLIEPDLAVVADNLERSGLDAHLYMGIHDKVIKVPWAHAFARHAPERIHVHPLDRGHIVLVPDTARALLEDLAAGTKAPPG